MSEQWEYFDGRDSSGMYNNAGYRISSDGRCEWYYGGWMGAGQDASSIRKYCRPVPTEAEAIEGPVVGFDSCPEPKAAETQEKDRTMETTKTVEFRNVPACPYCGRKNDGCTNHVITHSGDHFNVRCKHCGAEFRMMFKGEKHPPPNEATALERQYQARANHASMPLPYRMLDGTFRLAGRIVLKTLDTLVLGTFREGVKGLQRSIGAATIFVLAWHTVPPVYNAVAKFCVENDVANWPVINWLM